MKTNKKKWNIVSTCDEKTAIAKELAKKLEIPFPAAVVLVNRGF